MALVILMQACATVPSYRKIQVPAYISSYLSECSGRDGTVSIELSEKSRVTQVFDADWTSEQSGNWGLASYSPLGQTLFQVEYDKPNADLKTSGQQSEEIKKFSVSKDGIMMFDGHELGLRADEVGCFLSHKIPQKWISQIVRESQNGEGLVYDIRDGQRRIRLQVSKHGSRGEFSWKANIEWSLYWGLQKVNLSVGLLRSEPAILVQSDRFKDHECRIVVQEE